MARGKQLNEKRKWTTKEIGIIHDNVTLSDKELLALLPGRTLSMIKNTRNRYEIPKVNNKGRFQKSCKPWNKGISYTAGGRAAETRFKKGDYRPQRPLNTVYQSAHDGKPLMCIKLPSNKSYPFARYVYQQAYGVINSTDVIRHIDGNPLNCELSNLLKVTRADHVRMNQNRTKAAASLKSTWSVVKTFEDYNLTPPFKFRSKRKAV